MHARSLGTRESDKVGQGWLRKGQGVWTSIKTSAAYIVDVFMNRSFVSDDTVNNLSHIGTDQATLKSCFRAQQTPIMQKVSNVYISPNLQTPSVLNVNALLDNATEQPARWLFESQKTSSFDPSESSSTCKGGH
jgi:hypothetical protein